MSREPLIQALARAVAEWFPELGGRSIAVSEVDPFSDKTNVPTLPIAVTALVSENNANASPTGGNTRIQLEADILVQFIFEPVKYQREDGQDSPFFAFYDYEALRDRLIIGLRDWRTPRGGAISYRALDVESDEFAVYLAFRLRSSETWAPCPVENDCAPMPRPATVDIKYRLYPCKADCPETEKEPKCP